LPTDESNLTLLVTVAVGVFWLSAVFLRLCDAWFLSCVCLPVCVYGCMCGQHNTALYYNKSPTPTLNSPSLHRPAVN
jgi:hypothetical protein